MGATITMGKIAAAFEANDGITYYALFEQMYEKNCYPHTPEWSCWALGTIAQVLRRVLIGACSCESGMLRGRSADILSENYIAAWLKELSEPVQFNDRTLQLKLSDGFRASIPGEQANWVRSVLLKNGHQKIADQLQQGDSVELSLYGFAKEITEIYDGDHIGPWRIMPNQPYEGQRNADLGYRPKPVKASSFTPPNFLFSGDQHYLVQQEDGGWKSKGWAYSIVGSFIVRHLERELREPGSYKSVIKQFREKIKSAPLMPSEVKLIIRDGEEIEGSYARSQIDEFRNIGTPNGEGFEIEITPSMRQDKYLMYNLFGLPAQCATWVIPALKKEKANDKEKEQLDFFA